MTDANPVQDILPPEAVRRLDECVKTKSLDECIAEIVFGRPVVEDDVNPVVPEVKE